LAAYAGRIYGEGGMATYNFSKVTTMVVDDSSYMRRISRTILRSLGVAQVIEASDGAEALARLAAQPPDLIVCDLSMNPVDGVEFVRRLRRGSEAPQCLTPIIMMTAHAEPEAVCAARDAGTTEFLAKPVSPRSMADRIVRIIERPRPFIRTDGFFGPDRRRRDSPPGSPRRRAGDTPQAEVIEL
jgi:two-component system, chemotaxis family, chemotaxis protein CheY